MSGNWGIYDAVHADASNYSNGASCVAWVNTKGCIFTPDHPDPEYCASCEATAVSGSFITEIDAFAEASAHLPISTLYLCTHGLYSRMKLVHMRRRHLWSSVLLNVCSLMSVAVVRQFVLNLNRCYVTNEQYRPVCWRQSIFIAFTKDYLIQFGVFEQKRTVWQDCTMKASLWASHWQLPGFNASHKTLDLTIIQLAIFLLTLCLTLFKEVHPISS
jgi:hypothetical protein